MGVGIDDPVWVPTVFTKNRDRLLTTEMSRKLMAAILAHREVAPLLSDEHFSADGTLVKAWASMKTTTGLFWKPVQRSYGQRSMSVSIQSSHPRLRLRT